MVGEAGPIVVIVYGCDEWWRDGCAGDEWVLVVLLVFYSMLVLMDVFLLLLLLLMMIMLTRDWCRNCR